MHHKSKLKKSLNLVEVKNMGENHVLVFMSVFKYS